MQKSLPIFYLIIFLIVGIFSGFVEASVGNTSQDIYYGKDPIDLYPRAKVYEYPDSSKAIDVLLPNRTQFYLLSNPAGFMPGWIARFDVNDVVVTGPDSRKYIYPQSNNYRIKWIKDYSDTTLVIYDYNSVNPNLLEKQIDGFDPNLYIEYEYEIYESETRLITLQGWDDNTSACREYTISYDDPCYPDQVKSMTGSCSSCGGSGGAVHIYDINYNLHLIKDANDDIMYEMLYTTDGMTHKYIGDDSLNNLQKHIEYSVAGNGDNIVDTYEYVDSTTYRVIKEYQNSGGYAKKRIKFEDLNEDPNDPSGQSYTENFVYTYSNGVMIKRTAIPASVSYDPNDISGIRKEYSYDPNSGRLTEERWFDVNDVNFPVSSYTYDPVYASGSSDIIDYRVDTYVDVLGSATQYSYSSSYMSNPSSKFMPQFTDLSSNTLQLKYYYTYDNYNRITLEQQKDYQGSLIVTTKYEYGNYGNLVKRYDSYQDINDVTEYQYNGFNDLIKQTSPSGVVKRWGYNNNGKLQWEAVVNPTSLDIAYSQTVYTYDDNGRVILVAKAKDDSSFTLDSPDSWVYTSYGYDILGNKTQAVEDVNGLELTATYAYNNQNEVTKVTLPNGKWTETVRDGRGLVKETIIGYDQTNIAKTGFVYDTDENVTEENVYEYDSQAPEGLQWKRKSATRYEYDDFDRVIKVTKGI